MLNKIGLFKQFKTDTWVKPFLRKYKFTLIFALLLGAITFFCAAALMFNSGYLISKSATQPYNILLVYVPIVLTRAFGFGRPVFHYIERLTSHDWVLKMTSRFRLRLYNTLQKDAIFFKNKYQLGDILGLLAEDIGHIQNLYLRTIFPTLIVWILYFVIIACLGFISLPFAALMFLLLFVIIFLLPLWSVIVNGARQEQEKQLKNELYLDLTDNILGVSDWIFADRPADYLKLHAKNQAKLAQVQASMRRFAYIRDLLLQIDFLLIVLSLICFGAAYFGGEPKSQAANWIAAFVLAAFPLNEALANLPGAAQETNIYQDSLARLNALPEKKAKANFAKTLKGPFELTINDLHFHYEDSSHEVLKAINLAIAPQQKIALLGRSGSGKSTLAALLRGDLTPSAGKILLNGVETTTIGAQISDYIGVIQQSPYLFHTTIRNNLQIANHQASDAEIWQVLQRVGLKKLVEQLPQQLDTLVDEAGLRFSGGERHRLALARILLKDVPIIILDEPTVGLDPVTEQALLDTFANQLADKTLIWITHHLQGIEQMDRVIFIEDGEIELSGTPQELAATNLRYQKLKAIDQGQNK